MSQKNGAMLLVVLETSHHFLGHRVDLAEFYNGKLSSNSNGDLLLKYVITDLASN